MSHNSPVRATVTRTVTSVADKTVTFTAYATAPDGYDVVVYPSTLTLAPGESASYDVTFTNVGAPIGEWRFGDLTWMGGGYHVRSPIALKGVQLGTPDEVTGGPETTGTTSFAVQFGYTGAYTAAAHGLVPAVANDAVVFQDPDQDPTTPDDVGGIVSIPFDLNGGVALARWSLDLPTDDDLDMYLYNSAGELVAQSTNGGTAEFIELQLPEPDVYTMDVHGWAVVDEVNGVAFSLQSWLVPTATGGSLVIDSAPTEAVTGAVGIINLSWAGLTAATSYLGAVSHSDDAGVIALTAVSVNT